jgi:hypothetical protein
MITMPKPARWKAARSRSGSATDHEGARSDIAPPPVLTRQCSPIEPVTLLAECVARARQPPKRSHSMLLLALDPAQIPIAPEPQARSPIAVSSPGGFRTPAPGACRTTVIGRHPKTFTTADIGGRGWRFSCVPISDVPSIR